MTHEEDSAAFALGDVLHLADGFLLELGVAYGEDFVHDEDLGFEKGCYGEAQTDSHSRTIALNRGVDIPFAAAEVNDLIELGLDLGAAHAEDSAVHEDILATGHFLMKTRADFQERAYTAVGTDSAGRRAGDTAQQFKKCRFAGTVLTDDADDIALLDLEVDIAERPDVVGVAFGGSIISLPYFQIGILTM